tara:strand:+ start:67 stop:417 length:351 start_codon:yes stop_codon:yes gene_type:complete
MNKKIIYVDIDGTISYNPELPGFADRHADYKKAEPHADRIAQINKLYDDGHEIHYWTARGSVSGKDYTTLTAQQLKDWGAKYHDLHVGNKPHFDMYICDKSWNSESYFSRLEKGLP